MSKSRRRFTALLAAAALILLLAAVLLLRSFHRPNVSPAEVSFALNGADYPLSLVLQDFIDRGWRVDHTIEETGDYSESTGPASLVDSGYCLTSGGNEISVYLDIDQRRAGVPAKECSVRSIGFQGQNVESFRIDGKELSSIGSDKIEDCLGDPGLLAEDEYGRTYRYILPENNISELSCSFPYSSKTTGQIFVTFDLEN